MFNEFNIILHVAVAIINKNMNKKALYSNCLIVVCCSLSLIVVVCCCLFFSDVFVCCCLLLFAAAQPFLLFMLMFVVVLFRLQLDCWVSAAKMSPKPAEHKRDTGMAYLCQPPTL
jgi:hypothetical protein